MTKTLIVDPELQAYLPPLDRETKALLEDSIVNIGRAVQPIEVWKDKNVICDGHHRYEICTRLGLPYEVREIEFASKRDVMRYMLEVQVSRRNLTKEQAAKFRGQYVKMLRGNRAIAVANGDKTSNGKTVAQEAAETLGVSEATVKRDAQFTEGLTELEKTAPEEAKAVEKGTSKINKGTISKIGTATTEEAKAAAVKAAVEQSKREHKKQVNRVTNVKPAPTVTLAQPADTSVAERAAKLDVLVEKLGLFLTAKTPKGRQGQMKIIVGLMNEIENGNFTVPDEYQDDAAKAPAKVKDAPPLKKATRLASDD